STTKTTAKIISCRMMGSTGQTGMIGEQLQRVLNETGEACRHLPMVSHPLADFRQLNLLFIGRAALRVASPAPSTDPPARGPSDNGHEDLTERPCSCLARSQANRA